MASIRLLMCAVALFACAAGPIRAEGFLHAYEDLPLAPGLAEVEGAGVSFDSPNGRIVEAYARGKASPEAVMAFYADTLPQLGWTRRGDGSFRREAEVLRLSPVAEKGGVSLRFSIAPE